MPISPARAAAFDILLRVETTDAYASELLHSPRTEKLSRADHGLATEIVMGVLRWRSVLDEEIAAHLNQRSSAAKAADNSGTIPARLEAGPSRKDPLSKLDVQVVTALRIGAYQLRFLDRIPAHAAINESVELVKKARKRSAAGMVNAVLRKIDTQSLTLSSRAECDLSLAKDHTQSRDLLFAPNRNSSHLAGISGQNPGQEQSRYLHAGIRFASESSPAARNESAVGAHPAWLVERWQRTYGIDGAEAICRYDQQTPNTTIRANKSLVEELAPEDVQLEPGRLLSDARVVVRGDVTRTRAFRERRLIIQDEGSQLIALLLGEGKLILDCCAAPGGKTRIIAERNPNATVVAMELHPHRAALISRLVPLHNVHVISADARNLPFATQFDRILVDAPCTGTGTLARNPEIKWRLQPEDISRLQAYQVEILTAAMQKLAPGGQLLYSTCSLESEENQVVVEGVLRPSSGFRVLDIRDRLAELHEQGTLTCDPETLVRGHFLRTVPGVHPCDGFFAALLEREM